mgnify:CR=1 FL=1|jgi:menaquinone-specific isochorismate synthase
MTTPLTAQTQQSEVMRLVSVTIPAPGASLPAMLAHGAGQARLYWDHAHESIGFAGVGAVVDLSAWGADRFAAIHQQARTLFADAIIDTPHPLAAPRLFGGFAFRDDFVPDNTWVDFAPAQMLLPHYQLTRVGSDHYLTLNAQIPAGEDAAPLVDELRRMLADRAQALRAASMRPVTATPVQVNYPMTRQHWESIITRATQRIRSGDLNKVVLARVAEIRFDERIALEPTMAYLEKNYPSTYRFVFEPRPRVAFFGATPETLVKVAGETLTTMALAGSIRRGATDDENNALVRQLLGDRKERYEHQIVIDRIAQRLAPLAADVEIDETGVLALPNIQHLYTPIQAVLRQPDGVLPVLEQLHPTPALGGDPADIALQVIAESEPVPRGWYGAPVGWMDHQLDGHFAVAIRSGVAQDRRVWVYAGCGVVADSQPDKEWNETALKFRAILHALGVEKDLRYES